MNDLTLCRICAKQTLTRIIDLGFHPIADTFLPAEYLNESEQTYPLCVGLCSACGYAGLEYVVPAETRYQKIDYSYTTGNSTVSIKHFTDAAAEISDFASVSANEVVMDIGSNDGTLLAAFRQKTGCNILGIEPAPNIAALANAQGIPTVAEFFTDAAVPKFIAGGKAKVLTCANVLNHASLPQSFVATVAQVLSDDGFFVFEVPYLLNLVQNTEFDTIYLEHISYFGVQALKKLFDTHHFSIVRVERTEYMGGSLRVYVGRGAEHPAVAEFIAAEHAAGLYDSATYADFMERVKRLRFNLCRQLYEAKASGKRVVGVGAATKGNTLLNYCKIDASLLDFITDQSPLKVGKFTPGSHIPIQHDDALDASVDIVLILPWNIADFLTEKLKHLPCAFIVPHTGDLL